MWEILSTITNYILKEGGIYGVFIILLVFYIGFKEWKSLKFETKDEGKSTPAPPPAPAPAPASSPPKSEKNTSLENLKDLVLILERQKTQTRILEENSELLNSLSKSFAMMKDDLSNIDKNQNSRIDELTKILNSTNKERLEDLKEILLEYNKVVNDLNLILKSDFSIKRRS